MNGGRSRAAPLAGLLAALAVGPGCRVLARPTMPASAHPASGQIRFTDVTAGAGIDFRHHNGAYGKKYYPESMGAGCAFFDYDGDGWPDLLFVNGTDWPDAPRRQRSSLRLYRNCRNGTFEEVTRRAGLEVEMYGIGCTAGDYDSDGDADLYVTAAQGPSRLFQNRGGTFADVTRSAGVDNQGQFAASAAWLDYDRDGLLDLFVCNYIRWTPAGDLRCEVRPGIKEYCTPRSYDGLPCRLYRNLGDGRFADVSGATGIRRSVGKSLGVALCDENGDGWLDLAVTNDTEPTFLFRNHGGRTFSEVGTAAGIAFSESGKTKAGMGIDAGYPENDAALSIATSNFSGESLSYFRQQPDASFLETASRAGLGHTSLRYLGWGLFFVDADLDGWQDLFVANGHIYPDVQKYQPTLTYAQRPLLYRNTGSGRFEEVGGVSGSAFRPLVGRGATCADFDRDGDPDLVISANGGPARLLRNDSPHRNNWLSFTLEGTRSNRDAIGAVVRVTAGGQVQTRMVRTGGSYASQSDRALVFGLGAAQSAERVEVRWPSGATQTLRDVATSQHLWLREGDRLRPHGSRAPGFRK